MNKFKFLVLVHVEAEEGEDASQISTEVEQAVNKVPGVLWASSQDIEAAQ